MEQFAYDPGDEAPTDVLNPVNIKVYLYDTNFENGVLFQTFNGIMENQQVFFSVDVTAHPNGGKVVIFTNYNPTAEEIAKLTGPNKDKSLPFSSLDNLTGDAQVSFHAGDQLIGGNGRTPLFSMPQTLTTAWT
jgi:hypothetical protein